MDWFERLTGFREADWASTQARLRTEGDRLCSDATDQRWGVGRFEMASLAELRRRVRPQAGRPKLAIVRGDVRALHQKPEYAGALFQVASQFNMLEMPGPSVTPEAGVAGYAHDHTQGPACAMAAGAATIYRNYLVPVAGGVGQTAVRQLDGLRDVGAALAERTGLPLADLWTMRNGYALATARGLDAIGQALRGMGPEETDALRGRLRIGLHRDVEVTDAPGSPRPHVSQAFCSALPVAYAGLPPVAWAPFARLVLEAAYEATLLAAAESARGVGSATVLLTLLGGGVFGNQEAWILDALRRALALAHGWALDVRIVSYGAPTPALRALAEAFAA